MTENTTISYNDYLGERIDRDRAEVDYLLHDLGRVVAADAGKWIYEYHLTDHLGNVRVAFADLDEDGDAEMLQENHYYPFGQRLNLPGYQSSDANPYLYNGKELQEDLGLRWYDYGARFYDAQVGRWWSVDPLAEKYYYSSTFNYTNNNPIRFIDPDGRFIDEYSVDKKGNIKHEKDTDDNDVLYTKSDYDNGNKDNGVVIEDESILSELKNIKEKVVKEDAEGTITDEGVFRKTSSKNKGDMAELFTFLAINTEVEWSMYSTMNGETTLGTFQFNDVSPGPSRYGLDNSSIKAQIHSHPNPTSVQEEESSLAGDRANVMDNNINYKYFVYMGKSSNLYMIDKSDKVIRQKNISSKHVKVIIE